MARKKVPEIFTMDNTLKLSLEKQTRLPHARNRSKRREYSTLMSIKRTRDMFWESDLTQM